ncbi:MAG: ATP-binding cassette domain-containing protein [Peptoniphilus harei]|nr:ATP-binding cassette domain-containing protein [Peptoniphilus harei]
MKSVDFSFKEGVNGLIGANGAGKTTLMRLITKYYKLSSGEIRINLENDTNLFDNETINCFINFNIKAIMKNF